MRFHFNHNTYSSFSDHHRNHHYGWIPGLIIILLLLWEPESWYRIAPENTPTTPTTPAPIPSTPPTSSILTKSSMTQPTSPGKILPKLSNNGIVVFSQPIQCIPNSYR